MPSSAGERMKAFWLAIAAALLLAGCNNSPWPDGAAATNTIFNSFDERSPRYLDPTASYSNPGDALHLLGIYEPMYAYHYLKRPYVLDPEDGRRGRPRRTTSTRPAQRAARRRAARADRGERLRHQA